MKKDTPSPSQGNQKKTSKKTAPRPKRATKKSKTKGGDNQPKPEKKSKKQAYRGRSRSKRPPNNVRHRKSTPNRIRIIPLGGVEEVGCNMIAIEIGNDIFVSDVGFQFASQSDLPGIDYLLPDTRYLEKRSGQIQGVFITHAHLDHIGGIPFLMEKIGNPTIYTMEFTKQIIEKRQLEFHGRPKLKFKIVEMNIREKVGNTYFSTFPVTHSIPDSFGLKLETRKGNVVISGDLKLDHENGIPSAHEEEQFGNLGKEKNLILIADSTNAERPGFSITEREIQENIADIVRETKGRLFVGTFASQLSRIIKIISVSKECGKKIALEGRSIVSNVEIASKMGLIDAAEGIIIPSTDIHRYPKEKVVVICTGAQGEENATLTRIANHRHRSIKFEKGDTILLSSSVIPGNELAVQTLRDRLCGNEVAIIHYRSSDVHATGHGNAGELVWINKKVGAKYFLPAYGFRTMTTAHINAVVAAGFPRENAILAENGTIIDLSGDQIKLSKAKEGSGKMMVDGSRIDKKSDLIKDRTVLGNNGIVIISIAIRKNPYRIIGSPRMTIKGVSLKKDVAQLARIVEDATRKALKDGGKRSDEEEIQMISDAVSHRLIRSRSFEKNKKPLIIPIVMTI